MFSKYHYLAHSHHFGAQVFIGFINNEPVAFYSVLPFPHPKLKNARRGHRLVVLPDYQGIGIGGKLSNYIAEYFTKLGFTYIATTSSPQVINSRKKSKNWIATRIGRVAGSHNGLNKGNGGNSSRNRITTSWKYVL